MHKKKILVVDDSSTVRKIIQDSLERANLNVGQIIEASNGREALDLVQHNHFDLILTDIDMPVMDGLELIEALNVARKTENTPVVVITKHTSEEGVLRAMEAGARGYIREPFTIEELWEKVAPIVGRKADALERAKSRRNGETLKA